MKNPAEPISIILLIGLLCASLSVPDVARAQGPTGNKRAGEIARAELARQTPFVPAWQGAYLSLPKIHYDLDGQVSAYVFSVEKGEYDLGYITIGAGELSEYVLEFSTAPARYKSISGESIDKLTSQGFGINEEKPLYLGPLSYFYPIRDPAGRQLLLEMSTRQIIDPAGAAFQPVDTKSLPDIPTLGGRQATQALANSLSAEGGQQISDGIVQKLLYGPDYSWYRGCAPTAAGNVIGYWSDRGYPKLVEGGSRGSYKIAIEELAVLFNTTWYGWTFLPVHNDIEAYAADHGYTFASEEQVWPGFKDLMDEIDNYRPVVIVVNGHYIYGSHFITMFGYQYDTNAENPYMIVHDTYDHGDYFIRFGWGYTLMNSVSVIPPKATPDKTAPESAVNALPPSQLKNTFTVSWSGTDTGWGIYAYDVQYRDGKTGSWTNLVTNTLLTQTSFIGADNHTYYFRSRAMDYDHNRESYPDGDGDAFTTIDRTPPVTHIQALPAYQVGQTFTVDWEGQDNASGISWYDIQVREGQAGQWRDWITHTRFTRASFTGLRGLSYYFQSRGVDGNLNPEAYPSGQGDASTYVAAYAASGSVKGNRGTPVPNARLSVDPAGLGFAYTNISGSYVLGLSAPGAYRFTASASGYGLLNASPGIQVSSNTTLVNFILPPTANLVSNWSFEQGLSQWQIGGSALPTTTLSAHTGSGAVRLGSGSPVLPGSSAISQTVTLPSAMRLPTLSFLYNPQGQPSNQASLELTITPTSQSTTPARTYTLPLQVTGWQHAWFDLSDYLGQSITLRLLFTRPASSPAVLLDEVSLGPGSTTPNAIYLPSVIK